jgi:hypothetical protein
MHYLTIAPIVADRSLFILSAKFAPAIISLVMRIVNGTGI